MKCMEGTINCVALSYYSLSAQLSIHVILLNPVCRSLEVCRRSPKNPLAQTVMEGRSAGGNGFVGPYAGFPDLSSAPMTSGSSDLNSNSSVSMAISAPLFTPQGGELSGDARTATGAAPPAKRMKMEPTASSMTSMASASVNPSVATPNAAFQGAQVGSGLSTEQFLQTLPAAYGAATPAFVMMMQQQQQQLILQRQTQAQAQAQAQQAQVQARAQANARAQAQVQLHLHRQAELQRQQQLHSMAFAASQQAQTLPMMQTPAQARHMAALARNQTSMQIGQQLLEQAGALQVKLEVPSQPRPQPVVPQKLPHPTGDPVCVVCGVKGESDLFVCESGCALAAHPKCIGEDQVVLVAMGKKFCGSCYLTQVDRKSKENFHSCGTVGISTRRAVLALNAETNAPGNFDKFGHLTSLRLIEIGQIAGYPIGPFARKFVEAHLQRWISEKLAHFQSWANNVRDIFTLMLGLYSLDRAAVPHAWRDKVLEHVRTKNLSTTDFLGWHPALEGPVVRCSSLCSVCCVRNPPELLHCARCRRPLVFPTTYTKFISAMLATHYAEGVGISFGTTFLDVFAHTHTVRGLYKGLKPYDADGHDWDMFLDQMRMIFGFVDILSGFGVLELDAGLFEPEVKYIFNERYINHAMLMVDFEAVGRFLQSMKLFGAQKTIENHQLIDDCEQFLMVRQLQSGSWCKIGANVIDQFKATVACAKALVKPMIRGRGPISSETHRYLVKWAKKTPGNAYAKRAEQLGDGFQLACGATVRGKAVSNLKKLDVFYRRQIVPTSGLNALETLVTTRLHAIRKEPSAEPEEEDNKDDVVAAVTDNEDSSSVKAEKNESADGDALQDDELTNMSLNGELSLFDGLKFEDGDVIDISGASGMGHGEGSKASPGTEDGEGDGENDEVDADAGEGGAAEDEGDDDTEEEEEVYDDDDDGAEDGDNTMQLPEPEVQDEADQENGEDDSNTVDMSILDNEALDDSFALDL